LYLTFSPLNFKVFLLLESELWATRCGSGQINQCHHEFSMFFGWDNYLSHADFRFGEF
jgi:hypothetical protein